MNNKIIFGLYLIALLLQSCTKPEKCARYFEIPATIKPAWREYHVGDTILIESTFSKEVLAFNSENTELHTFDMSGIKWEPITLVFRIDTLGQAGYSSMREDFVFYPSPLFDYAPFTFSTNSNVLVGEYAGKSDSFTLVIKLSCKTAGTFFLRQNSRVIAGATYAQDFPGRCGRNGFDVWVKMNDGVNNNVDLLKESPDPYWNNLIFNQAKSQFYQVGGCCFRVLP